MALIGTATPQSLQSNQCLLKGGRQRTKSLPNSQGASYQKVCLSLSLSPSLSMCISMVQLQLQLQLVPFTGLVAFVSSEALASLLVTTWYQLQLQTMLYGSSIMKNMSCSQGLQASVPLTDLQLLTVCLM